MANCCSNSCGKGCYGALGSVVGPLAHCGFPCACSENYRNFPFYNGPCAPGPYPPPRPCPPWWGCCSGGCGGCAPDCPGPRPPRPCAPVNIGGGNYAPAAQFAAFLPIAVSAGGVLPFEACFANSNAFAVCDEGILLRCAGNYLATCIVRVPSAVSLNTGFALAIDGNELPCSSMPVETLANDTSQCCVTQALFSAGKNALLSLVSNQAFAIDAMPVDYPFASLTLQRLPKEK